MVYRAHMVDWKRLKWETCQPIIYTILDDWKSFPFWIIAGYPNIMISFVTNKQTPNEQQKVKPMQLEKELKMHSKQWPLEMPQI